MIDYTAVVDSMQKALGRRYQAQPQILNTPGKSLLCKIDPFYYLGLYPDLFESLAVWAGIAPSKLLESLLRTGNLVRSADKTAIHANLALIWVDRGIKRASLDVSFIHSSFVDRAVKLYGNGAAPRVSTLKIAKESTAFVQQYLQGKTEVQKTAFF